MYTPEQIRLFCEIGVIKSLGDLVQNYQKNSRFGGFLKKLEKECTKIQRRKLKYPSDLDLKLAGQKIDSFGYAVGWTDKKMSPNYMFCFCSRLAEESKYLKSNKIKVILGKLLTFQEERETITDEHYTEGDKAYTVWLSVWGEEDEEQRNSIETKTLFEKMDADIYRQEKLKQYKQRMYG